MRDLAKVRVDLMIKVLWFLILSLINYVCSEDTIELLPSVDHVPVGKQTVAEAAKQCGSSLHLYRNPLSNESDEQDTESSDEDN